VREEAAGKEGVPLGVKDLIDTAGLRTTYGSIIYDDHVPERSAECVRRLERAGYVVVGKTNLHEFAYGVTSENPHFGPVRNPLDPSRVAGGSSGGSAAALAAGMCDAALGTDSGGSIRIPAACCGVVGLKTTHGLVPMDGVFPLAPSFDTVGPMARNSPDCAAAFAVLAETAVAPGADLASLRIGVAESFFDEACSPGIDATVRAALARLPQSEPIEFPGPDAFWWEALFLAEAAASHLATFPSRASDYGRDLARRLDEGRRISAVEYLASRQKLVEYRLAAALALEGFDLLATPTLPCVAPPLGTKRVETDGHDWAVRDLLTRYTRPFNSLGWPALALPCGEAEHGLPASLQLVGRPGDDALVLAAGAAVQELLAG
jgi:aspartyl-tRNA(Asn)/glutamyl-tRNA(Gln) amidotransferase subunit A